MAYLHLNVSDGLDFESLIQFLIKVLFSLFLNLNKTPGISFFLHETVITSSLLNFVIPKMEINWKAKQNGPPSTAARLSL